MSFRLSRRAVLKGTGATLPLPFLNAMAAPSKRVPTLLLKDLLPYLNQMAFTPNMGHKQR